MQGVFFPQLCGKPYEHFFSDATQSRCKQLFCRAFELSTIGVEAAVGNLVAPCYRPLFSRLSAIWLFFDQVFNKDFQRLLSSFL